MACLGTKLLHTGVLIVALAAGASRASGAAIYRLELEFGDVQLTSASAVSDSVGFHSGFEGTNFYSRNAFASAEPGRLRASSTAAIQLTPAVSLGLGSILNSTDASAIFRLDDVVISGPGTGSILTSLNMNLSGGLLTSAFAQLAAGNGAEAGANASVSVHAFVAGNFFSGTKAISSLWQVETQSGGGSTFEDGLLAGFTGPGTLVTPEMMLPVGSSFVVQLGLETSAATNSRSTILGSRRQADASSLYDSTFSFPLSGPVFNLPEGFTANSLSGLIVNNLWQGLAGPQPIPAPSSFLLAIAGLLWLARPVCGRIRSRVAP